MRSGLWLGGAVAVLAMFVGCGGDETVEPEGSTSSSASTTTASSTAASTASSTTSTASTGAGGNGGTGGIGGNGVGGGDVGGGGSGATGGGGNGVGGATGGGGTGGIGGMGAGGAAPANDACPGTAITLGASEFVTIPGSTVNATDDYTTFCADTDPAADSPDVVFAVTLSTGGNLTMLLDDHVPGGTAFDGAISVRKQACDQRVAKDDCVNFADTKEKFVKDLAAGTYYVVIDGAGKSAGDFIFTLKLDGAKCGDGIINDASAGEQCDPVPQDDTCYPPGHPQQCKFKPPPVSDLEKCPGSDVTLQPGVPLKIGPNNNTNYADNYKGTCPGLDNGGRDHVYRVEPQASGTMTVQVGIDPQTGAPYCDACVGNDCPPGCWTSALYVRKGACEGAGSTEVACAFDPTFTNLAPKVTVPVNAFESYWVFVDANWGGDFSSGPYYLDISLSP